MNHSVLRLSIFSIIPICFFLMTLSGCADQTYTFRCSCDKIAYYNSGEVIDESFNQTICDTTENIEAAFTGELATITQECEQYFESEITTQIEETDCNCECDLLGPCN